jgi:hypothetical protein
MNGRIANWGADSILLLPATCRVCHYKGYPQEALMTTVSGHHERRSSRDGLSTTACRPAIPKCRSTFGTQERAGSISPPCRWRARSLPSFPVGAERAVLARGEVHPWFVWIADVGVLRQDKSSNPKLTGRGGLIVGCVLHEEPGRGAGSVGAGMRDLGKLDCGR